MKKLLMGSIALFLFSASIMLFQVACKKEVVAQTGGNNNTVTQQGKLISLGSDAVSFNVTNFDGSGKTKINVAIPSGWYMSGEAPELSPDGKTLFFEVVNSREVFKVTAVYTYSCNIDGTNVKKVEETGGWRVAY